MSPKAQQHTQQELEQVLPTSFAHRGFTLVGSAFVLFEVLFLTLLTSSFWFAAPLTLLSIPALLAITALASLLLRLLETRSAAAAGRFIWQGKPPLLFLRWLTVDELGFTFGARRILWEVVDEADLTYFGNLLLRSRRLCGGPIERQGKDINPPDVLLKIPFAVASLATQQRFMALFSAKCPQLRQNNRLQKQIAQPRLRGAVYAQSLGVVFLAAVFLDLGSSTFSYLDTLKEYYLCRVDAGKGMTKSALAHLTQAEYVRTHPLPISWVTQQLTRVGSVSDIYQRARIDALWSVGKKEDAISVATQVAAAAPKTFRGYLRLARLYKEMSKDEEAERVVGQAIEKREDALLPHLYLFSLLAGNAKAKARQSFNEYSTYLDKDVFSTEPEWPPGGERFLTDVWYREDLHFVLDPILDPSDGARPAP